MRYFEITSKSRLDETQFVNMMRTFPKAPENTQVENLLVASVENWLIYRATSGGVVQEDIFAWLMKKVPKYLANYTGAAAKKITPFFAQKVADETGLTWITQALARGEDLYAFSPTADVELDQKVQNVVDWMKHLMRNDEREYAKIGRYSFEQADQAQQQWHATMAKKSGKTGVATVEGAEKVMDVGDHAWWQLTSPEALESEGEVMGHCVGGYDKDVASGKKRIYSLRDSKNRPHVTIEVGNEKDRYRAYSDRNATDSAKWAVQQVKGKGNAAPVERYQKAVQALVNKLDLKWGLGGEADMKDGGAIRIGNDYVSFSDVAEQIASDGKHTVFAYVPEKGSLLSIVDAVNAIARVFIGKKEILTARYRIPAATGSYPYIFKYEVADGAKADDLITAHPYLWKVLRDNHPHINLKKSIDRRSDDPQRYPNFEIEEIIRAAGYVRIDSGYGRPDQALQKAESDVVDWTQDNKLNGFGAISNYVNLAQKYGKMSQSEALDAVKKIIPKQRLTPKIKAYCAQSGDVFLYKDTQYEDASYWFWNTERNSIYDKETLEVVRRAVRVV